MTTLATPGVSTPSGAPIVASTRPEMANVGVDALITGRTLRYPVYDPSGVLLLAEGQVITGKFKELIRGRNIVEVQVRSEEVTTISLPNDVLQNSQGTGLDSEITKQLDSIIASGKLFVSNNGPAVLDQVISHGCKAYDEQQRQKLVEDQKEVTKELDGMMREALHGGKLQGHNLLNATAVYLTSMTEDIDNVLTAAQEVGRDATIAQHCMQVSLLAMAIGIEMRLDAENVRNLGLSGLLHDWGMVRVPEAIRQSERMLSAEEFVEIKKHPIHSLEMLEKVSGIPSVVPLVCYQVHERPNGTGYPRERIKHNIHPFARILHVADQYVALTSHRPYRKPLMPYAAMECLLRQTKMRAVDADAVRALLQVNSLFPIGSFVALDDGSVARVLRRNGQHYSTPIIQLVQQPDGQMYEQSVAPIVDLSEGTLRVVQALPTPGRNEVSLTPELLNLQR